MASMPSLMLAPCGAQRSAMKKNFPGRLGFGIVPLGFLRRTLSGWLAISSLLANVGVGEGASVFPGVHPMHNPSEIPRSSNAASCWLG